MANKKKRYYKIEEVVYVRPEKTFGIVKGLNINPSEGIYKANIEMTKVDGDTKHIMIREYDLHEIDKDKRRFRKKKHPVGLNKSYFQVRDFQLAFGHPVANRPTFIDSDRLAVRVKWTQEELQELLDAKTVVDQADAVIDAIYFLVGTMVEMGVKPDKLFDIVQEANMGKLHDVDGKLVPVYKEDGKVKKPENWQEVYAPEPRLKAEVERQSNA
jgi:predicted HAD superfamily Cof-like phosphohydrolase